jgi:hypothetical protein
VRAYRVIALLATMGVWVCAAPAAAQSTPEGNAAGRAGILAGLDQQFQQLYRDVHASLVRISVTQSPLSVLTPEMRADFDKRRAEFDVPVRGRGQGPGSAPGSGDGRGGRGGAGNPGGGRGGGASAGTAPAGGGLAYGGRGLSGMNQAYLSTQVVAYLRSVADKKEADIAAAAGDKDKAALKAEADRLRSLAFDVEINRNSFQGDMAAVVFDNDGHVLLPMRLLREMQHNAMPVTLPDGKTTTARFVGGNLYGGYTIMELAGKAGVRPLKWSQAPLVSGQLLLSVTAGQGLASLDLASARAGSAGPLEEHLALSVDERSGAFLTNIRGELVAVVVAGGGWQGEGRVLYGPRIARETDYIIHQTGPDGKPGKDIEPLMLGVSFTSNKNGAAGVLVTSVDAGSPAAKAGLKENDVLLEIEGHAVSELLTPDALALPALIQMELDFATRTGSVPLKIQRGGKEQTLQLPLG